MTPGSRMSVLPISKNTPPGATNRSDASTKSPASESSTTSTPRPPVTARNLSSNSRLRESEMWSSSKPIARKVSHLPRLAVANTSNPKCRANCTAAIPTPPAAACTNTRCPGLTSARCTKAIHAVVKTADIAAASAYDQSAGFGSSRRTSPGASVPLPSGKNPYTESPTANSVTPGPTSTTTPAPSPPSTASWVNMPSVIMMSRKFAATACSATRTQPGSNGASALGTGSNCRFSNVPALVIPSRHGTSSGGANRASTARLPRTRGT